MLDKTKTIKPGDIRFFATITDDGDHYTVRNIQNKITGEWMETMQMVEEGVREFEEFEDAKRTLVERYGSGEGKSCWIKIAPTIIELYIL